MSEGAVPAPQYAAPNASGAAPYTSPSESPADSFDRELGAVDDNALIWLIIGAAGFWFGFGWLTGPLSWYFGAQARNRFRALGRTPSNKASGAWIVGVVSTVVTYAAIALVTIVMLVIGAAAFTQLTQY